MFLYMDKPHGIITYIITTCIPIPGLDRALELLHPINLLLPLTDYQNATHLCLISNR